MRSELESGQQVDLKLDDVDRTLSVLQDLQSMLANEEPAAAVDPNDEDSIAAVLLRADARQTMKDGDVRVDAILGKSEIRIPGGRHEAYDKIKRMLGCNNLQDRNIMRSHGVGLRIFFERKEDALRKGHPVNERVCAMLTSGGVNMVTSKTREPPAIEVSQRKAQVLGDAICVWDLFEENCLRSFSLKEFQNRYGVMHLIKGLPRGHLDEALVFFMPSNAANERNSGRFTQWKIDNPRSDGATTVQKLSSLVMMPSVQDPQFDSFCGDCKEQGGLPKVEIDMTYDTILQLPRLQSQSGCVTSAFGVALAAVSRLPERWKDNCYRTLVRGAPLLNANRWCELNNLMGTIEDKSLRQIVYNREPFQADDTAPLSL
jgi:hypothetical protein